MIDRVKALRHSNMPTSAELSPIAWSDIVVLADGTLATPADAKCWLQTPHPLLGGLAPIDAGQTPAGTAKVRDLLVAMKYGGVA